MEPAGSGATWTQARRVSIGQGESTRIACSDGVEVILNVNSQRSDVRSIAWLGLTGDERCLVGESRQWPCATRLWCV
jgi:hypothetical protein